MKKYGELNMDKLKTRVLFIALIILALVSVSAVAAADSDEVISDTQDNFDLSEETNDVEQLGANAIDDTDSKGPLTAGESGNFTKLQELVNGTPDGGILELDMNYTLTSDEKPIIVNKTITIDGKGHTLDAKNLNAIMSCLKPVILKNIIFTNAYCTGDYDTEYGYNIYYYGALTFNSDEYADISCAGSIVDNCTFKNNEAYNGAGIYIFSDEVTVINSRFEENEAVSGYGIAGGAAIAIDGDNCIVKDSNFTDNVADKVGGAIFWTGSNGLIDGCNFTSNKAPSAGAVEYYECNHQKIINSYFSKNKATNDDAGAVRTASSTLDNITIDNCVFEENSAVLRGGAIRIISIGPINLTNSKFYNNTVDEDEGLGGAIDIDTSNLNIDNVEFINNTAYSGGAFYLDYQNAQTDNVNVTVSNSKFIENTASNAGGAITSISPDLTIDTCVFEKNKDIGTDVFSGGGAINVYYGPAKLNVTNSQFKDNFAATDGGAIKCAGANSIIDHSTFENNHADRYGGAVHTSISKNIVINDSEFKENTAPYGGAMFVYGPNNIVKNSKFNDNNATARAGAIYVAGANVSIDNDKFNKNNAPLGGAIYSQANNTCINNSAFEENVAKTRGGALYLSGGSNEDLINNTDFKNNNASDYGGAIWTSTKNTVIDYAKFNGNNATNGSAIFANKGSLAVSNTDLFENQANAASLTLEVADIKNHFDVFFKTDFKGEDNLLNGININDTDVTLTNVNYHGFEEEMNTGADAVNPVASADDSEEGALVYKDAREAGINITVCVFDENDNFLFNLTDMTDIYGNNSVSRLALPAGKYKAYAVHEEDAYYTYIKSETILFEIEEVQAYVSVDRVVNYTGAVVTVIANVTDADGNPIDGGTATYIIHYDNKLSSGLLMAAQEEHTAEVINGKAVFEGIILGAPGVYPSSIEYSGNGYYTSATNKSEVEVLPLNTTTESDDVSGSSGDKVDIVADIVDQNGKPVQNGTAVLKVNGKEYTAEVKDGKAVFKGVELTENTTATIEYLGNDYYNPSNTTIEITVTAPEEPAEETSDDPEEPAEEPEEEPSTPVAEKAIPIIPATGNPIALVILALLTLVSTVSLGNKK